MMMRKRFLVLMLVFSIASAATATITITGPTFCAPGDTITLTLTADAASAVSGDYGYVILNQLTSNAASDIMSNIIELPPMILGDASIVLPYPSYAHPFFYFVAANGPGQPLPVLAAGDWISFDITSVGGTDMVITLEDLGGGATTDYVITVPEPMTIGLLGLGALMLRRKKRA